MRDESKTTTAEETTTTTQDVSGDYETFTTTTGPMDYDEGKFVNVEICKKNLDGEEIKGAQLSLTGVDKNGKDIVFSPSRLALGENAELITTESGTELIWISGDTPTTVKNLRDGQYTLHEVAAPNGYEVTTDIIFTIEDGKLVGDAEYVTDNSITMIDDYAEVTTTTTETETTTTTTVDIDTATETTTESSETTTTTSETTVTSTTTAPSTDAPPTGVEGVSVALAMMVLAAGTAFAVRRKKD